MGRGSSGRGSQWEKDIDNASFGGSGRYKRFEIDGVGGAGVESGFDEGTRSMKWYARTWTQYGRMLPVDDGRAFSSREEANARAKEVLKRRRREEIRNGE